MPPIDTTKWVVTDTPPPVKRNAATQAAFDFFWKLELGKSVLIPLDEASTAKNAAAQLKKESGGNVEFRFRDEGDGRHVRATKLKDYTPEQKAEMEAASSADAEPAPATE